MQKKTKYYTEDYIFGFLGGVFAMSVMCIFSAWFGSAPKK